MSKFVKIQAKTTEGQDLQDTYINPDNVIAIERQ